MSQSIFDFHGEKKHTHVKAILHSEEKYSVLQIRNIRAYYQNIIHHHLIFYR
ncbi:hypothetical protein [Okeania sp. SIO2C2]|uniref:hypothetical protein n=1 Tax=Okeania sp. SIO2C2 TaxID=2607787 RepID=UPI00257C7C10|nr:hypothetical protein [Okeania sp. SIO2C2]